MGAIALEAFAAFAVLSFVLAVRCLQQQE